jgi:hypothetical protein
MLHSVTSGRKCSTYVMSLSDSASLVFGLDWTPLVGGDPTKLGRKRARSLRATHYLIVGGFAAVVGCGVVLKDNPGRSHTRSERTRPLHAAAAIFALAHPEGVIAAVSFVPAKGYWLVAANSGLVLAQTDRWFDSVDQADAALLILKERFPNLQVLRYALLDESTQPEWLKANLSVLTRLQKLPSRGLLLLTIVAFGLVTAGFCWRWSLGEDANLVPPPQESASALWEHVVERFAHAHPIHPPEQLFKVVHAWHQAPVSPSGWKLKQIVCEPSNMDWHCVAQYQRMQRLAQSQQLDAAKPEGWTVEFPDLDHGMMRWKILGAASVFEMASPSVSLKDWLSYLQSVTPIFESIQIGSGTQITLPAPMNQQGVYLQKPSHIKQMKRRMISIKGPLRSISALRGLAVPVRWRSLQLELGPAVGQGISRSALTVSLMGDVFELSE